MTRQITRPCDKRHCRGQAEFYKYCGAYICDECGTHVGLDRCFCGWSRGGGNGRDELIEMGETIEPEDY